MSAPGSLVAVTGAEWDARVLGADELVLVDFWAPWCAPCITMEPALKDLAARYAGRLTVATLNVDQEPDLAMRYNITSIPAMKLFQGGQVVKELIGARPKPAIEQELAAFL